MLRATEAREIKRREKYLNEHVASAVTKDCQNYVSDMMRRGNYCVLYTIPKFLHGTPLIDNTSTQLIERIVSMLNDNEYYTCPLGNTGHIFVSTSKEEFEKTSGVLRG